MRDVARRQAMPRLARACPTWRPWGWRGWMGRRIHGWGRDRLFWIRRSTIGWWGIQEPVGLWEGNGAQGGLGDLNG